MRKIKWYLRGLLGMAGTLLAIGLLASFSVQPTSATAGDRYVATGGSDGGSNDCTNIASPCRTIGYAIDQAADGNFIRIGPGTYPEHLDVAKNLTFVGAGMDATFIDGSNTGRVMNLEDPYTVAITNLTIQHGNSNGSGGGGIANSASLTLTHVKVADNVADLFGGGIANNLNGQLMMSDSLVSGNQTTTTGGAGGGLELGSSNPTHLTRVTISGNTADEQGGGIEIDSSSLYLTNVTLTANQAKYGAGLHISNSSTAILLNSTIAANTATGNAGGVMSFGSISFTNTIVANNFGNNCSLFNGTVIDMGYNLESGSECGFTSSTDLQTTNPLLGPLADNGGPTPTMALLPGSPAINAGTDIGCPSTDQRGVSRFHCDIGAYEVDFHPVFLPLVIR